MVAKVALVAHWDWVLCHFRLPLARRLAARGAEVTCICPPGEYVAQIEAAGFRWLPWCVERRGMNPAAEAAAVARLLRLYGRQQFDVVHHFTIKPILYGTLAARAAGVKRVINTFSGLGYLFSDGVEPWALRTTLRPLLRWALWRPGVVTVFQNEADRDRCVGTGLVPAERASLIPGTGVDVERFAPGGPRRGGPPVVLFAGRLLWDKGVAEYVEAAVRLDGRGVRARFLAAGEPDPGNPRSIPREQIARWSRNGPVEFLGRCGDMAPLLRRVDVAVLPSYYYEGVPLFLLEAAATGVPIVASDIPGCRAVVEPGKNGLLVPPRDPAALAAALGRLLEDPKLRDQMGAAGRRLVLARYDQRAILDRFEALYRALGLSTTRDGG